MLLFPAVVFAQDICGIEEENCKSSCCTSAGGALSIVGGARECSGEVGGETTGSIYTACVAHNCRPAALECTVPGSGCDVQYSSCFDSCITSGNTIDACDDICYSQAGGCAAAAMSGTSTFCGPAALLGFLMVGALYRRK
ncbi:MAG: hypothetical protein PHF60_04645 [Candidatus ainarchaeum sp.]|nr:hypothetical protein [Candidatus ainarchaeum sp.]